MRHIGRTFGVACALFATTVASGCAAVRTKESTQVPIEPIAGNQQAPEVTYGVALSGAPGGAVTFASGFAERELRNAHVVHVPMTIRNDARDRELTVAPADLWLEGVAMQAVPLSAVDGKAIPDRLRVAPGQRRTFDLAFRLPGRERIDDLHDFRVHWTLDCTGGVDRVERRTEFATIEGLRQYGAYSPNPTGVGMPGDLPSTPVDVYPGYRQFGPKWMNPDQNGSDAIYSVRGRSQGYRSIKQQPAW